MNSFLYYIRRLFSFSGSILYWNIIGMAVIGFLEGISILLLVPLINLSGIVDFDSGKEGLFDILHSVPETLSLPIILLTYVLLVVGQNLFDKNLNMRNVKIAHGFIGLLRIETYEALLRSNWGFFTRKRSQI